MAKNDNLTDFLKGLADKFRSVLGTADPLNPQEFEDKIQGVYDKGFSEGGPTGITATAPDVLSGKVFGSGGSAKATGTMPDRGQYQYGTFGSGTGYVAINALPEGYYHSDGQSWAPEARISNSDMASGIGLTAAKIAKGQTILGISGSHSANSVVQGIITVTRFNNTLYWATKNQVGTWSNQTLTVKTSGTLYWNVAQGGRNGSITNLTANVASGTKVSSGKTITFSASGGDHTCSAAVVWVNP